MKFSINHKLISRNQKISQIVLYASLALLVLGFVWSIRNPDSSESSISYMILIPAYILVQVSILMANKWGRSPRHDEIVATSLKGLDNQYTLYNYSTGVPHLLVGPAGILIINPYHHSGEISYNTEKKRYDQKGGPGIFSKIFAQEGLPSIERETGKLMKKYQNYVKSKDLTFDFKPQVIHLFYSDDVSVNPKNAPDLLVLQKKLKDMVRKTAKKISLQNDDIDKIIKQLPIAED